MDDMTESDELCRWQWYGDGMAGAAAELAFAADGGDDTCPSIPIVLSGGPAEKLAPAIKTSEVKESSCSNRRARNRHGGVCKKEWTTA